MLERHLTNSNNCVQTLVCDVCGRTFSNAYNLKEHKRMSHDHESSQCSVCGKVLKNKLLMKKHFNRNHLHRLSCEFCAKEFSNNSKLKVHIYSVHTENDAKPFICGVCGKGFGRREHFKEHERIHNNERPYQCAVCDYATTSLANRNKHERMKHKYERGTKYDSVENPTVVPNRTVMGAGHRPFV